MEIEIKELSKNYFMVKINKRVLIGPAENITEAIKKACKAFKVDFNEVLKILNRV